MNHDESGLIFKNVNNVSTIESYKLLQYTLNLTSFLNTAQLFNENAHKILEFCENNKEYEECYNFITNINEKIENYNILEKDIKPHRIKRAAIPDPSYMDGHIFSEMILWGFDKLMKLMLGVFSEDSISQQNINELQKNR